MNVSFQFDKLSKKFPARKGALSLSKFEVSAVKTVSLKIKHERLLVSLVSRVVENRH